MIINLEEVFLYGHSINSNLSLDFSKVNVNGFYIFKEPVDVKLRVENHADVVSINIDATVTINTKCDRCTIDICKKYKYSFSHVVVLSLSDDMPCDYVEAKNFKLDVFNVLMSDVLLELPTKFLCKDSCKGICQSCGKNLNNESCKCHEKSIDPRFEVLRQLIE